MITQEMIANQRAEKQRLYNQMIQIKDFMQRINEEYNEKGLKLTKLLYVINSVLMSEMDMNAVSLRMVVSQSGWSASAIRKEIGLLQQGKAYPLVARNKMLNITTLPIVYRWLLDGARFKDTEGV